MFNGGSDGTRRTPRRHNFYVVTFRRHLEVSLSYVSRRYRKLVKYKPLAPPIFATVTVAMQLRRSSRLKNTAPTQNLHDQPAQVHSVQQLGDRNNARKQRKTEHASQTRRGKGGKLRRLPEMPLDILFAVSPFHLAVYG